MRITHLARYDCLGGAARSAYRLHAGLSSLGHTSAMVVQKKLSDDPNVFTVSARNTDEDPRLQRLRWLQDYYIDKNRSALSNTYFSLSEPGFDLSLHPAVQEAEILHLHWVAGFLSPRSIGRLASLGKPIVWTLHDQRPYTGGCHFSAGCRKYEADCADCPQLEEDWAYLAAAQLQDALRHVGAGLTIVCPSEWMSLAAGQSTLFKDVPSHVIPYGVDTHLFCPKNRSDARQALGLDNEATYLLFGADNANEKRKGFENLLRAVRLCADDPALRQRKLALLCLGHPHPRLAELSLPVVSIGYTNSDEKVSTLYAAADIFVLPSLEDNLPNTVLEAMSSGVPVVAFAVGGVPDMVKDNITGKLVTTGDIKELARAIACLVVDKSLRETLGANSRTKVEQNYTLAAQAECYAALYEALLAQPAARTFNVQHSTFNVQSSKTAESQGLARLERFGNAFGERCYRILSGALATEEAPERRPPEAVGAGFLSKQALVLRFHLLRLYHGLMKALARDTPERRRRLLRS